MVAYLSKSDASARFDQIVDFINAQVIQYALMVNPTIYVSCIKQFKAMTSIKKVTDVVKLQALIDRKKVVVTEDIIRQDLRLDYADGVECFPTKEIFTEGLPRTNFVIPWPWLSSVLPHVGSLISLIVINNQVADLSSHTTKYTSPALTQKVFANMRRIGKGFLGVETSLFATMSVQPQAAVEEEDEKDEVPAAPAAPSPTHEPTPPLQEPITSPLHPQSVPQSSPPQEQLTTTSTSYMTLLHTLLKTCITLSYKVATLEQDKVAQALEILKLKRRVKKLEKQMRSKSFGLKRLRKGRLEKKDKVNDATKEVNVAEPTVFDDEEVRPIFEREYNKVQTFLKPDRDEEPAKKRVAKETLLHESFKKLRTEVKVSGSHSTHDTPTDDPKEMSEEDVQNMPQIVRVSEFKVKALQVKYPLIDWEIYSEGSRSYWKIIRVGGITQAYKSFEDMLKDFDREDLDALWRLVKEKFSTSMPTKEKEKALWVELKRLYEPNAAEKDYPLTDAVLLVILSTKLQVDKDCEMARSLWRPTNQRAKRIWIHPLSDQEA
nr:hypothetical protein [Tanacetum cinerariifolium]